MLSSPELLSCILEFVNILFFILGTPKHVPITNPAPKMPQVKGKRTVFPKPLLPFFSFFLLVSKELNVVAELAETFLKLSFFTFSLEMFPSIFIFFHYILPPKIYYIYIILN